MLRDAGFLLWWVEADWGVSRRGPLAPHGDRAPQAGEELDRQRGRVLGAWDQIRPVFEPNILMTLAADGTRLPAVEIARRMGIVPPEAEDEAYEAELPE